MKTREYNRKLECIKVDWFGIVYSSRREVMTMYSLVYDLKQELAYYKHDKFIEKRYSAKYINRQIEIITDLLSRYDDN